MRNNDTTAEHFILWGGPLSVYTARVRSYLIKKQIPFIEKFPSHPDFMERIVPQLGFFVIPVLEKPNGEIIQDTSIIIDYLEERFPTPNFVPDTPVQNLVATLICAYGSEGLNQPSMHYRWSFMEEHGDYVRGEFGRAISASKDIKQRIAATDAPISIMTTHLIRMGITKETAPAIEKAYKDLLTKLNEHFLHYPYLLGNRPSMADFGLMTGLFAHLSRDPIPSALMKKIAPNVYRWTERMNLPMIEDGEFWDVNPKYPDNDEIPETLEPVLEVIFEDWSPELLAYADKYNQWLEQNQNLPSGHLVSENDERKVHPSLGNVEYLLRGSKIKRESYPHSLWHFQKAQKLAAALNNSSLERWSKILERTGGSSLMSVQLNRPLERKNNVLVLM